ncbi:MAG: hypothetical protein HFACDABA_00381 [Anaerolineales bacterium]|nr:hypothetical protein [Anaerolineales bacterium]
MHAYLVRLTPPFRGHADPGQAVPMEKHMRDQFEYLRIKSPLPVSPIVNDADLRGFRRGIHQVVETVNERAYARLAAEEFVERMFGVNHK